jgi:hypothetical protein
MAQNRTDLRGSIPVSQTTRIVQTVAARRAAAGRHLTKGERAMAHAMLYQGAGRSGRGKRKKGGETPGVSARRSAGYGALFPASRTISLIALLKRSRTPVYSIEKP